MEITLRAGLPALNLELSDAQVAQFVRYCESLLEKNKVMNLTANPEPEKVATLHFHDCLNVLKTADFKDKSVVDVGCGAGFPGVPLKIAEPSIRLTLVDSLQKRVFWLRDELLPELGIEANCVAGRAEEYAADNRERFDIATSRAVARLNLLAELCLPLVKVGGYFLALKGADAAEETGEAEAGIKLLGGKVERIFEYPVEDAVHRVVVIKKVAPTPKKYPRQFAKIKKQPL
ncbi:MAG: 16S rRNA (guanine(527)-N(7))-methyltransferase RsmG [Oscillospiraceae bacterium]|nr:16S rRNA (guanine(527)-N(7))-methyltransferase RsmG [Oscillospiraceae bacterium]